MQFHVHLASAEGDALRLQPESLFESVVSTELYGASRAQHALPGKADCPAQGRNHLACATGESGGFRHRSVSGDLATGNAPDGGATAP